MSSKFLGKGLAELNEEMGQLPDISVLTGSQRVVVKQIPLAELLPQGVFNIFDCLTFFF